MKTGKSLMELAAEITRQAEVKADYIAPVAALQMLPVAPEGDEKPNGVALALAGLDAPLAVNNHAHDQIGTYANIPAVYYDRMLAEAPDLLATNVNRWLTAKNGEKRMVRALDGRVRAFLSDKFHNGLENADLAEAVLPILADLGVEVISAELTERRFYLKVVDSRVNRDIPSGRRMGDGTHTIFDTVCPVMTLSNSEVGAGSMSIESGFFTKACTNLAIFSEHSMKRRHVTGRHQVVSENLTHLLSAETRRLTDKAVWHQVRDVVKGAFEEAQFDARLDEVRGLAQQPIVSEDVVKVVQVASRTLGVTEGEQKSVLKHLIAGGDLTRYGLFNAITRTAEDLPDYDRATEFERLGGKVISLPSTEWKRIAEAA